MSRKFRSSLSVGLVLAAFTVLNAGLPGYSQTQPELRKLTPQYVGEPGCPVEVTAASTELEVDPFGAPMAARHYIDYRNVSGRPVAAVKFRIGYVADDGKIHQPYLNAPHQHPLEPGGQASQKWRGDRVDPKTKEVKIRVLMVKMADGSVWESQKVSQSNADEQAGFAPLTIESPGSDIASGEFRAPGTPVPLTEVGKSYGAYPERTTTGPVNFNTTQTPAAGFDSSAFAAPGAAPSSPSAAAGTYAPFAGANTAQPSASRSPSTAAPGFVTPGAGAPGLGTPTFSGFGAPPVASPAFVPASTPNNVAPVDTTPAFSPTAASPSASAPVSRPTTGAQPIGDPVAEFDKLMGNSAKSAPSTVAPSASAPASPVVSTPTSTPASASTPVAEPSVAPAVLPTDSAPPVAPPAAGSNAPVLREATPLATPEGSAPTDKPSGADEFAPAN